MSITSSKYKRTRAECEAILTAPGMPWELERVFLDGRYQTVWKNTPPYYRAWVEPLLKAGGDRAFISSPLPPPAATEDRETVTFAQMYERTVTMAAWMRAQGVRQGDRVAIAANNCAEWLACSFAIHFLGGVAVAVNSHMVIDSMVYCLAHVKPKLVIVEESVAKDLAPKVDKLRSKGVGKVWCWSSLDHHSADVRKAIAVAKPNPSKAEIDEVVAGVGLEGIGPDSPCTIYFTSGTTGYPKAVLSNQRQNLHNALSGTFTPLRAALRVGADIKELLAPKPNVPQTNILLPVPLFHCTGGQSWATRALSGQAMLVFMRRWSVKDAISLIKSHKINVVGGVPSIATALYQSPDLPKDHVFDTVSYGGAPPPNSLAGNLKKRWPNLMLVHGYGMTETNAVHTAIAGEDYVDHPDSVGWVVPVCEVKIVHPETKKELPTGEVGLIFMRGQNVMSYYVDDPEATAKALDKDGWLDSGDVGCLDEDELLYIRDRSKDLIIRGGENIASLEVENALYLDPRIAEAAAVPVPCPLMGERVGAMVSLAPGATATPESIMAEVFPRLRHAARPVIVLVRPEPLPRNANGKIIKTDVKKIVGEQWKEEQPRAKL
ncbi:acetyl-CoA synthetase-like protein [Cutaneotrichosporon oleaginosum]|uniref:Acetyl-CoA synthetase-like protein n=1 Tax=Cutaneotrichosporon oleaginosum TaxID=879819 RepID=A0A0J0XKD8_9TREE|nr:acetyl-CoA synthetase-like protein [Cutaneotrichosporon oleaginosum]KLT41561.1 acetyl-CoA synthetase-like protein [Cutaneotrichosporon oleaginosum]TXT09327.1 hypothetical protein COLE_03261 [Cutaneotrichosporon oleaginosum]